jgi:hypothetical protein
MIGLLMSMTVVVSAGEIIKMPMQDLISTDMDYVFEIKTNKFDKVVLDCQSFITGMSFSNGGVMKSDVYLDMFMCEEMVMFLQESKRDNLPVCIGLDGEYNELTISREVEECI